MNSVNTNEKKFADWLQNYPNHKYIQSTIDRYIRALKMATTWFEIDLEKPILDLSSVEEYDNVEKKFLLVPNYEQINKSHGHGDFSAALHLFGKYLAEIGKSEDENGQPKTNGLHEAVMFYKDNIEKYWKAENYKWVAVANFLKHWDIDSEHFPDMVAESLAEAYNLLQGGNYYPSQMICSFAKLNPEKTRKMFIDLFDEEVPLAERIKTFRAESNTLLKQLREQVPGNEKINNHYQDLRAICVYLSFRYPDKYYLYKYRMYRDFCKLVGYKETSVAKSYEARQYENFELLCNKIVEEVKQDDELVQMQKNMVASKEGAYEDLALHLLAQTIIYVYRPTSGDSVDNDNSKKNIKYWPSEEEYPVNITKEEWIKYIQDVEYTGHPNGMAMLKALMELGGEASCKKLSVVYGGGPSRYISTAVSIGKRAKKYFDLPPCMDGTVERFFPIPFLGREVFEDDEKFYSYRIREELAQALEEIDLTEVNPYVSDPSSTEEEQTELTEEIEEYTKDDFLREVFMSGEQYDTLVSLLENKKNLILQGAPGVGKTFAANRLAYSMMGEKDKSRIEFVQFHQNYSYEDFMMGYKPTQDGFELKYGIFYRFCKIASDHPNKKYFFVIDEINRGNMSKVFGELLMLIEKDYRGTETTLAYNGKPFSVPENLYIIGMMNTADRSLAMIDYALRRRFSFFTMSPGFDSEGFKNYQTNLQNDVLDKVITEIKGLNKAIANDKSLGAGFCIGHSYFCGHTAEENSNWIKEVVEFDIIPMLNEYWFDDADNVKKWSDLLNGVFNG